MKKISVMCDFGDRQAPYAIYIGDPRPGKHPLQHQAHWLSVQRGGTIPAETMDLVQKLWDDSVKDGVSFEMLCAEHFEPEGSEDDEAAAEADEDLDEDGFR